MIKDTAYNLEVHLNRVETSLSANNSSTDASIDLLDEIDVTRQCLRICEDAQSYLKSLQDRQAQTLPRREVTTNASDVVQGVFEAELTTTRALNESRTKFMQLISHFQERLASVTASDGAERERQMSQLREDINISKQCLEVCQMAIDQVHHHRKVYTVGEVIADDDADQMVVTTLADLFDVRKVLSKSRSAQLVGSMTDETLQRVSKDRYSSRFGAVTGDLGHVQTRFAASSDLGHRESNTHRPGPISQQFRQPVNGEPIYGNPFPNEARKRAADGEGGTP